jgi:hypothetical protein
MIMAQAIAAANRTTKFSMCGQVSWLAWGSRRSGRSVGMRITDGPIAVIAVVSLCPAQLAFFRDPFALLVQSPDPIFSLAVLALWKEPGYLVSTVPRILHGGPIFHVFVRCGICGLTSFGWGGRLGTERVRAVATAEIRLMRQKWHAETDCRDSNCQRSKEKSGPGLTAS